MHTTVIEKSRWHKAGHGTLRNRIVLVETWTGELATYSQVEDKGGKRSFCHGHYFDFDNMADARSDFSKRAAKFETTYANFLEN